MPTYQIRALRCEAIMADDREMVICCDRAIDGDQDAERECQQAIDNAAAQDDDFDA